MANKYKYVKDSLIKRRQWVASFKNRPCEDCGIKYPSYVMDFHHRNPDSKSFNIGRDLYRHSRKKVLDEIKKCDLLCANCHRIREHKTRKAV